MQRLLVGLLVIGSLIVWGACINTAALPWPNRGWTPMPRS